MKFRIRVDGKDSISEGCSQAASAQLKAEGVEPNPPDGPDDKYEAKHERVDGKLQKFVKKFVEDGEGGSDAVTVEFDTEAGTCTVVPVKEAKKKKK